MRTLLIRALLVLGAFCAAAPAAEGHAEKKPAKRRVVVHKHAAAAHTPACTGTDAAPSPTTIATSSAAILCLLNQQRAAHGLSALTASGTLATVSSAYAASMVAGQFFDHTSPLGVTFISRIRATGYISSPWTSWTVGENLGWGSGTAAAPQPMVDAWMHSAEHEANILDPDFHEVGVGIATGAPVAGVGTGAATYVTDFGAHHR